MSSLSAHAATTVPGKPAPLTSVAVKEVQLCDGGGVVRGFVPAKAKSKPPPVFPDSDASSDSEGWVKIGFTIDSEGSTRNVVVLDRVGSSRMISAAISAVKNWDYTPATLNGQPADQFNNTAEILYELQTGQSRAVHDNVIKMYETGRDLVNKGKYAEGIAILQSAKEERLNMFEQAMISFALAYAHALSSNPQKALPEVRHAMIEDGRYLEKRIANPAKRLRIRMEALAGNPRYVACAPALADTDDFDPSGADRKDLQRIISSTTTLLKSTAPYVRAARVPDPVKEDDPGVWEYDLVRKKFSFAAINGALTKFRVNCVVHLVEDDVKLANQWSTPEFSGPCILRVWGEPGTTFKLVEEW
ncbi:MAG: energy transducer TonB [Micropepsaceae bacterium]